MNIKNENGIYSITQKVIAQVVDKKEILIKNTIVEYAKEKSKELGEEIEILFIDKITADKIIDLGIKEFMKSKINPV